MIIPIVHVRSLWSRRIQYDHGVNCVSNQCSFLLSDRVHARRERLDHHCCNMTTVGRQGTSNLQNGGNLLKDQEQCTVILEVLTMQSKDNDGPFCRGL